MDQNQPIQMADKIWRKVSDNLNVITWLGLTLTPWGWDKITIPWICYERSFSEFYLSIWNQLVFNQRLQLFVQSPQPYLLIFCLKKLNVFSQHIGKKNKWISEFHRTNPQELKCWSTSYVNCFLRYYLMMQHQPIVKRVNGMHEWAHRPYQPQSAPYHCCLYKHRRLDERQPPQTSWPVPICT